jgi:hypothetical protein
MGNRHKPKPHDRRSLISGQSRKLVGDLDHDSSLVLSLKHFDSSQGQGFAEWEDEQLLAKMLHCFQNHCRHERYNECFGTTFKRYGEKMSPDSQFKHPAHVPPDADWASMHVQGQPCVIGHMFKNIFYVVFLDKEHAFWPSNLRNT